MEIFSISNTEYLVGCAASNSITYMYGYFIMDTNSFYAYDNDLTSPLKCQRIMYDDVSGDVTIYYLY